MSTNNTGLTFDINAGKNPKKNKGQKAAGVTKPREINVKPEYSKMNLMFGNGDNWIRPLPPIHGSEFPWILKFEIYRLGDVTGFIKTRSVNPEKRDLVYEFAAFCRGNEEFKPALYLKGTGNKAPGLRLWSQDRGICWVMLLNPDPKSKNIPLKLYHASMNNPNSGSGGSQGLMYQFYALTEEIDTDPDSENYNKPLYGSIWHPEIGRKININVTPKANSGRNFNVRPSGKVSNCAEQIAQLNEDFPQEIKMVKPLEDILLLPTDKDVLSYLKEYCEETSQKDNSTIPLDAYNAWVETLDYDVTDIQSESSEPVKKSEPSPETVPEVVVEHIQEPEEPETPVTSTQEDIEEKENQSQSKNVIKFTKARLTLKQFNTEKNKDPEMDIPEEVYTSINTLMEDPELSEDDNTLLNDIGKFI